MLAPLIDNFQLSTLKDAALLCERIRDTNNQLGKNKEADGAEQCRAAIQTVINTLTGGV